MTDTQNIKYIEAILREGNITRGAKSLYISQPYLSKIINNIEKENNITLFDRYQNRLHLTFAGERYLHYLKEIKDIEEEMEYEIDMISNNLKGQVHLGINTSLGITFLPQILPVFYEKYPDIEIILHEYSNTDEIERLISENTIDLAIGMTPIINSDLSYDYLYEEYLGLLVHRSSKLYRGDLKEHTEFPFPLSLLSDEPLILLSEGLGLRKLTDEFFELNDIEPQIVQTTSSIYTAINLTATGLGSTFVTAESVNTSDLENVQLYPFSSDLAKTTFVLLYKRDRKLPPHVMSLYKLIKDVFLENN